MKLAALCFALPVAMFAADNLFIPADDPRLGYSDYATKEIIVSPLDAKSKAVRLSRPVGTPSRGYEFHAPGARLRFKTDAAKIAVTLYYNDKHASTSARNPIGRWLVDGETKPEWRFRTVQTKPVRTPEKVEVNITAPTPGKHDYEIVLPYGDSADIVGINVPSGASVESATPRPERRIVFYGDSVTHGFTASEITGTYPWLVTRKLAAQMVNLGIGGRGSAAGDAKFVAAVPGDLLVVLIGVNDWQGGRPANLTRQSIAGFLRQFRAARPDTPVAVITPLWVGPKWKPASVKADLESYRQAVRDGVKDSGIAKVTVIDGTQLIDHDEKYFDPVLVHPNDAGFRQMAERLAAQLPR